MKKALLVILSLVMVISFTSCQKDTSAEVLSTFEAFTSQFEICSSAIKAAGSKTTSTVKKAVQAISGDLSIDVSSIVSDETKTKGTITGNDYDVTIAYNYTSSTVTTAKEGTLTVVGTYTKNDNDETGIVSYSWKFTINGEEYDISCTTDVTEKFTSAYVNGQSVNVALLNSQDYLQIFSSEN